MEVSNKTLVMLLLATLAITVFGTLSSLNKISGFPGLTGAWQNTGVTTTTYGSVNLTITATTNINFTQDQVNFGSGYVTIGSAACRLETSTANNGCTSFTDGFSVFPLLLENQGNTNVKLNLSNINDSASLIGGQNPGYAWRWNDPENDAANTTCNSTASGGSGAANTSISMNTEDEFRNISNSGQRLNATTMLCAVFNATDSNDLINISFKLLVPSNAPAETGKYDTWTATAVAI